MLHKLFIYINYSFKLTVKRRKKLLHRQIFCMIWLGQIICIQCIQIDYLLQFSVHTVFLCQLSILKVKSFERILYNWHKTKYIFNHIIMMKRYFQMETYIFKGSILIRFRLVQQKYYFHYENMESNLTVFRAFFHIRLNRPRFRACY